MELNILILPGDGIGPEVTAQATAVLEAVCAGHGHRLRAAAAPIGAAALAQDLPPLPEETLRQALAADAVLLGAVGTPEADTRPPDERPERGLLDLRRGLGVYANLRPVRIGPVVPTSCPLRPERVAGTDLLIVRELTGGLYYGRPSEVIGAGEAAWAVDTMTYTRAEIRRVAITAFEAAARRRRRLTSVDKANVLACSRLWRETVDEVAVGFPEVDLEHLLVDACAMRLVSEPTRFDVLLTENLFGDILSDEAAVLAGSIGLLPSASLGGPGANGRPRGLYEPIHGSAPDLAGRDAANPIGAILSAAAMLRHTFRLYPEAADIERAVDLTLSQGPLTADLDPRAPAPGSAVGAAVRAALRGPL